MPGAIDRGVRILHVLADLSPGGAERLVLAHARATPGVVVAARMAVVVVRIEARSGVKRRSMAGGFVVKQRGEKR